MSDYATVERAIGYIDANWQQQPSLADVAAAAGLSEFHFQRLFTRWAGISPKRFLQFVTARHAGRILREDSSNLDAAMETGLSSVSRLHDLVVTVHAATPGEWKRRGAGPVIRHGTAESPFGPCTAGLTELGVCWLAFDSGAEAIQAEWPRATFRRDDDVARKAVERAFEGGPTALHLFGTNWQIRVWEALLRIPEGETRTYEDIAADADAPRSTRAAASAVASNKVAWMIPCHRVIRKTGAFGEYRWGSARKRAMLAWESGRGVPRRVSMEETSR